MVCKFHKPTFYSAWNHPHSLQMWARSGHDGTVAYHNPASFSLVSMAQISQCLNWPGCDLVFVVLAFV